ncbi:MAG: M28 family peptidase [Acidobacteria bacterium]|nr:M28 family peptidase [Acidobacteriota bacterium]
MRVVHSTAAAALVEKTDLRDHLARVSAAELRRKVEEIAIPRHFRFESENNRRIGEMIFSELDSFGYQTRFQGRFRNVLAHNRAAENAPAVLVGAHYDSVPNCPGADDNASAVAALLVAARLIAEIAPEIPVCFAAFNCEEDGLVGSTDFVVNFLPGSFLQISRVHILEMIGFATDAPDSQKMPPKLPVRAPAVGNFLGILGNRESHTMIDDALSLGKTYLPDFPLLGLKLYFGVEKLVPDLGRSDHYPFWQQKIPAVMWTDTSNFRNPHYHRRTDTPDTLDYSFMKKVTRLLLLNILSGR